MKSWILIVLAAASIVLAGCGDGGGSRDPAATTQKIYRHSMDQAPNKIDPTQAATVYSNFVILNVYDTLYAYKYLARPYTLKTNLATDLPKVSDDGLTYTISIKPGVHFTDDPSFPDGRGREVVAEDFVYSIKRHFDPASLSQGAWVWQGRIAGLDAWKEAGSDYDAEISGLRALDRHTIQITLTRPYPQLVHTLTMGFAALVPREAVEHYGPEFATRPVGSGPFQMKQFDTARAVLIKNPRFRAEPVDLAAEGYDPALHDGLGLEAIEGRSPPFVDRVDVNFVTEDAARWNSFSKGSEIQFAKIPSEQFDAVLSSKTPPTLKPELISRYNMLDLVAPEVIFNTFNMDFEEFGYHPDPAQAERNKALRCAVIKAFDWNQRDERFYNGIAKIFPGIIPPAVPEFDGEMPRDSVTRDVAGARKLLAEHDWTADNLPELTYGVAASVKQRQLFEQFRGFVSEIGYPSEKIVLEQFATFGDVSKAWKQSKLPFISKSWGLDYPDAENVLQLFYGPNGSPGSNDANFADPEYDRLYEQSAVMQPGPERTAIYHRMNQILVDSCVAVMGLSRTNLLMWHDGVIAYPDRNIVGGFWLRFVDLRDE
ncbi:MAG: ABC transporter substrate-binding protein [Gammaproteobacteria bacterium]|nr:ABC transporter substrate-binding protein [Gammaproteobacteria bacterium]